MRAAPSLLAFAVAAATVAWPLDSRAQTADAGPTTSAAEGRYGSGNALRLKFDPGPVIDREGGEFLLEVHGRLLVDGEAIHSRDDPDDGDGLPISKTTSEVRNARLGIEGALRKSFKYKLDVEFAGTGLQFADAWIGFDGVEIQPISEIRLGQLKTPNSLEEQTSNRFITFMERAGIDDAFDLNRRFGLETGMIHSDWTVSVGAFSQNLSDSMPGFSDGYALASRATRTFGAGENSERLLHIGGSLRYRNLDNHVNEGQVRYRQRPFFHDTNSSIDTGTIENAQADIWLGGEVALVEGPLSVQSEVAATWLRREGAPDASGLWGGYVDASYFLTGEHRNYTESEFGRVEVKDPVFDGGWGAWQIAGRVDYLDLNDRGADVIGGKQVSLIAGVNWYLNSHARMMLDGAYTYVFDGEGSAGKQIVGDTNEIWGIGMRAQVDF